MIIVMDTNVLVSALLTPFGTPARVLDLCLSGDLRLAYDDRIAAEYREVLAQPRFGFAPDAVDDVLDYLPSAGEPVIAPLLAAALPDPDDLPFLEVARAAQAPLITGNPRHFPQDVCGAVIILSPAEALERLSAA